MSLRDNLIEDAAPTVLQVEVEGMRPFFVRELDAAATLMLMEADEQEGADKLSEKIAVIMAGICNEDGTPAFKQGDESIIRAMSMPKVKAMAMHVLLHNGMASAAIEAELGKSNGAPSTGSDTTLPGISDAASQTSAT